jgi:nitrogen fixation/metabolism regulation signal transduction histidine kinase
MRISIGAKVFLGSLVIVFLNIFYVVVVYKLSDLNNIAHILKKQDRVQQGYLRIASSHDSRNLNKIIYDKLKKNESVDNFREISASITTVLDTLMGQLDSVQILDSAVSQAGLVENTLTSQIAKTTASIIIFNDQISKDFAELVALNIEPQSIPGERRREIVNAAFDEADSNFVKHLDKAGHMIDEQTKTRIKDIELRINNAKQVTIIILIGISIFAILFVSVFSSALTRSLRKLKESASYIGKGNFYFDPSGYPRDEVGDLASAFFDMAIDLKKTQEELIKSKRLAAIGEVVASVNHEINNPLMIISGNAQFLEMSMHEFPPEIKERVRTILEETERISQVTRKLREIKNPVVEDYTSSGEQMINLDRSSQES